MIAHLLSQEFGRFAKTGNKIFNRNRHETQRGIAMLGSMGSLRKDLVGFVSSVISGETRATWRVDDKPAYVSDESESDYFSWH
ncbi:hypothetical protein HLI18_12600 [Rhizobium laguerreae]|uniref:hypothetical protein n=1 Tax=Rhizobium laguerreae TaxID=1076926 RepID=UPI0014796E77|nr:hypothetical protein [Rhizobium laguerreae]NNG70746.1 hypothetical protein [Rhizobium laguerreae]